MTKPMTKAEADANMEAVKEQVAQMAPDVSTTSAEESRRLATEASAGQIAGIKQLADRLGYERLGDASENLGFIDPNGQTWVYDALSHADAHMLLGVLSRTHGKDMTPQIEKVVEAGNPNDMDAALLRTLQAQARPFANTGAYSITIDDVPPPESDFLTPSDLVLVHFYVLSGEKRPSKFETNKKVAEYRVLLHDYPEMGVKKLSLGSDFALKQFDELAGKDYPFLASVRKAVEAPYPNKPCILCEAVGQSRSYVPSPKEDKSSS